VFHFKSENIPDVPTFWVFGFEVVVSLSETCVSLHKYGIWDCSKKGVQHYLYIPIVFYGTIKNGIGPDLLCTTKVFFFSGYAP
jgi:hypothetical protein